MKNLILAAVMVLSTSVFAQTVTNELKGNAYVEVIWVYLRPFEDGGIDFQNTDTKIRTFNAETKLVYSTWGEGKIKAVLSISGAKKCPNAKSVAFVGIDQGIGEYDLYSSSEELLRGDKRIGTMSVLGDNVAIDLREGREIKFEEAKCDLTLKRDNVLTFKK